MKEKDFKHEEQDDFLYLLKKAESLDSYRREVFEKFIKNLPEYSPQDLYNLLEKEGYRGQKDARKMVCVAVYRHLRRIKMIYVHKIPPESLPEKVNYIFMGPTGCGKTYIMELLFGKILKIPYVIIDITKYSETGYVGENVINIPYKLIEAARGNKYLAQIGAIIIDEFDKIAGSTSNLRFAGAGTQKDVSGYGVQRELLKLLEHGISEYGEDHSVEGKINTRDILFVAIGAFSGFSKEFLEKDIGFLKEIDESGNVIAYKLKGEEEDVYNFFKYGFLPELIARFQRIIPFEPLDRETLKEILDLKIEKLRNEFKLEGFELVLKERLKDFIVDRALEKGVGARGIESVLLKELEKVAFDIFGKNKKGKVIIDSVKENIKTKIIYKKGE
ncbi:MAG: AAA family ATPase [candidate division WOR-3 bacterium]